jgi:hypothetical protein
MVSFLQGLQAEPVLIAYVSVLLGLLSSYWCNLPVLYSNFSY